MLGDDTSEGQRYPHFEGDDEFSKAGTYFMYALATAFVGIGFGLSAVVVNNFGAPISLLILLACSVFTLVGAFWLSKRGTARMKNATDAWERFRNELEQLVAESFQYPDSSDAEKSDSTPIESILAEAALNNTGNSEFYHHLLVHWRIHRDEEKIRQVIDDHLARFRSVTPWSNSPRVWLWKLLGVFKK